ncbi:MAG: transposase, partial [Spirochaetales bacterium]
EGQVKTMEKRLNEITRADRNVRLLMTIPGIGIVNACTISAYIDDISRFESAGHFSSFCGIVPWVQSSNDSSYYGRITKRGPQELRTALVQCVVAMIRMSDKTCNTRLMKQYAALKENKSSGKAIIATARKLSTVIYVMLRDSVPFDITKLSVS